MRLDGFTSRSGSRTRSANRASESMIQRIVVNVLAFASLLPCAALPPLAEDPSGITYFAPAILAHGITDMRRLLDDLGAIRKLPEAIPGRARPATILRVNLLHILQIPVLSFLLTRTSPMLQPRVTGVIRFGAY